MVAITRRRVFVVTLLAIVSASAFAAKVADVKNTRHNLSATPYTAGSDARTVKASSESQICVFCHTPHKANSSAPQPLWNRTLSSATYTTYTSESMDATLAQPDGSSKLCLSCHDGTLALGNVGVLNGKQNVAIAMQSTNLDGSGATTGYTRNLGTSLTNDHPISLTYNSALATADGGLVDPALSSYIKNRTPGATHPDVPLENGKVQCVACHDPHIRDSDTTRDAKFLRLNRFQSAPLSGLAFNATNDILCLACHARTNFVGSVHTNELITTQTYTAAGAAQRGFDANLPVWKASCLNCHDTHTVQGARRLLREGTDSAALPKAGGNPALEETCYQCHDGGSGGVLSSYTTVPNIKGDFALTYRMPITSAEQTAGSEVHAIGTGADATEGTQRGRNFVESPTLLGKGNLNNRHAECTDCHNPHRALKNRKFNDNHNVPGASGTHTHTLAAGQTHDNIISGVLDGVSGVEPVYGATTWGSLPTAYTLKKGEGGEGSSTAVASSYVTREYQICLKCHSDYAWTTPPNLGGLGLTASGTNGVTQYTNQAMEFQAPTVDRGEVTAVHRSWHPVINNTGRTAAVRAIDPAAVNQPFTAPWNDATATNIGNQTMYCSDCHGSDTGAAANGVVPVGGEDGKPWGPHGSTNPFLLKGPWSQNTGSGTPNDLCFKCHDWAQYADPNVNNPIKLSGFRMAAGTSNNQCAQMPTTNLVREKNLHRAHAALTGLNSSLLCTWCHVAVPHGWKNKALLVNLGADVTATTVAPYTAGPYYLNAQLGGTNGGAAAVTFATSGNWTVNNCGGLQWMTGGGGGGGGPAGGFGGANGGCPY